MLLYKDVLNNEHFGLIELVGGFKKLDNKINRMLYFKSREDMKRVSKIGGTLVVIDEDLFQAGELVDYIEELGKNKQVSGLGIRVQGETKLELRKLIEDQAIKDLPILFIPTEYDFEDLRKRFDEIKLFNFISKTIKMEPNVHIKKGGDIDETIAELAKLLGRALNRQVEIIDPIKERTYYNTGKILKINIRHYEEEYLRPDIKDKRTSIIESMKISSYSQGEDSWTVVPIIYNNINMFYIIVWEDDELGKLRVEDFKFLYISYMLIYILYGDIYFENKYKRRIEEGIVNHFIYDLEVNREEFYYDLKQLNKRVHRDWIAMSIVDKYPENDMKYVKKELIDIVNQVLGEENVFIALLDNGVLLTIYNCDGRKLDLASFKEDLEEILERIDKTRRSRDFRIGLGHMTENIDEVKISYEKSLKAVEFGELVSKKQLITFYEDLGVIAALDIDEAVAFIESFLKKYEKEILASDSISFLETMSTFISCNGNYKEAAEELYIHTNTLRYRINQIEEKFHIKVDDYEDLLEISIFLKFEPIIRRRILEIKGMV